MATATTAESAEGPFRLVTLIGDADVTSRHLKDLLDAEVAAGPPLLVLDLSRLRFLDSWALHAILMAGRDLRGAGGVLALASPLGAVRRVLELSGADRLVIVHDSVRTAVGHPPALRKDPQD